MQLQSTNKFSGHKLFKQTKKKSQLNLIAFFLDKLQEEIGCLGFFPL